MKNLSNILHVYNRGVDKRVTFVKREDYTYFIHLLYILNDASIANNTKRNLLRGNKTFVQTQTLSGAIDNVLLPKLNQTHIQTKMGKGSTSTHFGEGGRDWVDTAKFDTAKFDTTKKVSSRGARKDGREKLVEILAFVLMPNHFHLLLQESVDGGVSKFMQKIGTGYTMYFNKKYERTGALFQGRYKKVSIETNTQLRYIPHYIHLNPRSLAEEGSMKSGEVLEYLKRYRWSSFPDYIGLANYPSVTTRDLILSLYGSSAKYLEDITGHLSIGKEYTLETSDTLIDMNA